MKQTSLVRSSRALAALCLVLGGLSAHATTTPPPVGTVIESGTLKSVDLRVVDKFVTTQVITPTLITDTTAESIKFVDPTLKLLKSSDEVSSLTLATKGAGTMTVTANGENGNSASSSKTKLTVASTIFGTIGLGVDSCNRNILGIEVNSGGSCGNDFDLDAYTVGKKMFAESITVSFTDQVTLDSATIADGPFGGNAFAVAVDGDMTHLHAFKMGSFSLWKSVGLSLTGNSFTFLAYDPIGCKTFDGFYLTGINFHTTDVSVNPASVPEPESLALLLAGMAVVGGVQRRRAAKA